MHTVRPLEALEFSSPNSAHSQGLRIRSVDPHVIGRDVTLVVWVCSMYVYVYVVCIFQHRIIQYILIQYSSDSTVETLGLAPR